VVLVLQEVVVNESSTRQLPSDLCRGQPSGDSDSAASPHSNNEDSLDKRVDSNYTRLQQQQQQQWQQQQSRGRQLYDSNVQTQQQERSLSSQSRYSTGKQVISLYCFLLVRFYTLTVFQRCSLVVSS